MTYPRLWLSTLIHLFKHFKCELSKLRCKLSKKYLKKVRSSDEFDLFLTYLYLFRDKCAKYKLSYFPVFLMSPLDPYGCKSKMTFLEILR